MFNQIKSFKIEGLHGYRDIDLQLEDNTVILVGENGTGKTTVLRMLYYFLSGQWPFLAQYKFSRITLTINNQSIQISSDMFQASRMELATLSRRFPLHIRERIKEAFVRAEGTMDFHMLQHLCERYGVPFSLLVEEFKNMEMAQKKGNSTLKDVYKRIQESFNAQVLYLPTYRRIEQELHLIFKNIDVDEWRRDRRLLSSRSDNQCTELIEFGMKDVEDAINRSLEKLKEFAREGLNQLTLGYLGDIVDQKHEQIDVTEIKKTTQTTIDNALQRIPEQILSQEHKKHLMDTLNEVEVGGQFNDHTKVICHYFLKLLKFEEELTKREMQIAAFCKVCNQYMVGKEFIYNGTNFSVQVISKKSIQNPHEVRLSFLSSGEKQIVSLFSHLYLSGQEKFFVLIDEPELSLSVPWQRRFLTDIRTGGFCMGLVATTHSPFIYENDLKKYAHAIGEFNI